MVRFQIFGMSSVNCLKSKQLLLRNVSSNFRIMLVKVKLGTNEVLFP